jgi:hypothetical protein
LNQWYESVASPYLASAAVKVTRRSFILTEVFLSLSLLPVSVDHAAIGVMLLLTCNVVEEGLQVEWDERSAVW